MSEGNQEESSLEAQRSNSQVRKLKIAASIGNILTAGLGLDITDPNFEDTPNRVARVFEELCEAVGCKDEDYKRILGTTFPTEYSGMVVQKHIISVGLCPHHLLPVEYDISFAYIPDKVAIGISKIPRFIKFISHQPILQEDLTNDIVNIFWNTLNTTNIAVIVRGRHACMRIRGVKEDSTTVTSKMHGVFLDNTDNARAEFMALIKE